MERTSMSSVMLHAALVAELPHHCPAAERTYWIERLWDPSRLADRATEMQGHLQTMYASGWSSAYLFDDIGAAALPAAAASIGLEKLAIKVTELARMQPLVTAALAVAGVQLANCRALKAVSLQLTGPIVAPSLSSGDKPLPGNTVQVLTRFLRCVSKALEPHCHIRLLRIGLPSSQVAEVGSELQRFVTQLRRGAECRRLTILLGGHRRAHQVGCLLADLPTPLLCKITRLAVDMDSCRVEVDTMNPRTLVPRRFVVTPGPPVTDERDLSI